jgi:hypothetical protein
MTTPLPPIDPLDADELELARVLRALPGGEPSAALDARILRASQDALAQPSPRRRALWASGSTGALWGIGSAAAAILAVGIGWKLTAPPDDGLAVPRAVPVAADSASDQEATWVEFTPMPQAREDSASVAPPPPPPPAEVKPQAPLRRAEPAIVAAPAPAAPPAAMAAAPASPEPFPEAARAKSEEFQSSGRTRDEEPASAVAQDAVASPAATAMGGDAGRDAREAYSDRQRDKVLGGLAEAAKAAPAPAVGERERSAQNAAREQAPADGDARVEADAALAPADWLERVRARMKAGDGAGARASLRLFVARHPGHAVPTDLRPLLGE